MRSRLEWEQLLPLGELGGYWPHFGQGPNEEGGSDAWLPVCASYIEKPSKMNTGPILQFKHAQFAQVSILLNTID